MSKHKVSENTVHELHAGSTTAVLLSRRETLIDYLNMKVEAEDWHAVSDAACDLREVDAKIAILDSQ